MAGFIQPPFRYDAEHIAVVPFQHYKPGDKVVLGRAEAKVAHNCMQIGPNNNPWTLAAMTLTMTKGIQPRREYFNENFFSKVYPVFVANKNKAVKNPVEPEAPKPERKDVGDIVKEVVAKHGEKIGFDEVPNKKMTRVKLVEIAESKGIAVEDSDTKQMILDKIGGV